MKFALLVVAAMAVYLATLVQESSCAETVVVQAPPANGMQQSGSGGAGWVGPYSDSYGARPYRRHRRRRRHDLLGGLLGNLFRGRRRLRWDRRRGKWVRDRDDGSRSGSSSGSDSGSDSGSYDDYYR